jgi:hypothetical protein
MAKDPAFLFYPGDYLRDTQCLSESVQVAYDRIMCEHMRNICITQAQLNFFTKKLNDEQKAELMMVLTTVADGFQIDWVVESIIKRRAYSDSRRENRKNHGKKHMKTYDDHMENEIENVNESEIGSVDGKMLSPKMLDVWKKHHPDYPVSMADDLKALRRIAEFICKQSGVSFQPQEKKVEETVMGIWTTMSEFTATDSFYSSLSLKSIYNSIQSLSKKIINGKSGKNGKAPGTKITSADLNAARAKFRGQRESA